MCKTEKKKLCVFAVFCTEHFKKRVIVVYSFQEKNTNYTSWQLNFKKRVLPIKIISERLQEVLADCVNGD